MVQPIAESAPTGLLRYDPAVEHDLLAFLREAYPERPADLLLPRWRWMFLESAARLGVAPYVWLFRKATGIIAHQGALAVRLQVGRQQYTTGWFVETMVLPSVRNGAVGPGVITKARDELPFNLSLGQTAQMRAIQFQLGWKQVAPLKTLALSLNGASVLRTKIANPLVRQAVAAGLVVRQKATRLINQPRSDLDFEIVPIDRFDERHDRLWEEISADYKCAVVRDAAYLNWKYVSQPGNQFVRLDVRRGGKSVAVAVIMTREPDESFSYRRGFLVDLVVPLGRTDVIWATLEAARVACLAASCDLLIYHLISPRMHQIARSFGFIERQSTRFLLISPGDLPPEIESSVLNPDHWFITMGDSDIDRPLANKTSGTDRLQGVDQ